MGNRVKITLLICFIVVSQECKNSLAVGLKYAEIIIMINFKGNRKLSLYCSYFDQTLF